MPETQTTYRISHVGTTSDTLTSRGGLALFVRYLSEIQLAPLLEEAFGHLRTVNIRPTHLYSHF